MPDERRQGGGIQKESDAAGNLRWLSWYAVAGYLVVGIFGVFALNWLLPPMVERGGRFFNRSIAIELILLASAALVLFLVLHAGFKSIKKSEEEVRGALEHYRLLLKGSPLGIVLVRGAEVAFANPAAAKIAGHVSPGDLLGKPISEILDEDERQQKLARLDELLETGESTSFTQERIRRSDGRRVVVEVAAAPILYMGDKVVSLLVRDITEQREREAQLEWLTRVAEQVEEGVAVSDLGGKIIYVNPAWAAMHGYSADELREKSMELFYTKLQYKSEVVPFNERAILQGSSQGEVTHVHKNGAHFTAQMTTSLLKDSEEENAGLITLAHDITVRKRSQQELKLQTSYFEQLFENSPEGIIVCDNQDRVIMCNRAFEKLFGYSQNEIRGRTVNELLVPQDRQDEGTALSNRVLSNEIIQTETIRVRRDGSRVHVSILGYPIMIGPKQIGVYGIYSNITERKLAEERLEHLAHYDPLTNLPNRILFLDHLQEALEEASGRNSLVAVLFLDLDRFKEVNDAAGHAAGDQVLKAVARRLTAAIGERGCAARIGSDEFTVILTSLSTPDEVEERVRELREALSKSLAVAAQEFHLTFSIGVSLFPEDGTDMESLTKHADMAMYRAKRQDGNNYQFFSSEMSTAAQERLTLKNHLHRALEQEEWELHYQPLVNLKTRKILGVEALVRWRHPEWGLVLPERFIPLAEETGLIVPLGEWVLFTACRQNSLWTEEGIGPIPVSVNLSAKQFSQKNLIDVVRMTLDATRMDPSNLTLEITESTAMWDMDTTVDKLQRLNEIGVRLAIDDFGTGYSSLTYLKEFPIHSLKIDRSFIRDVVHDNNDAAIVQAIVTMGHGLRLDVVAEGVENREQWDHLRTVKCDTAQGFYYSEPITGEALGELVEKQRTQAPIEAPSRRKRKRKARRKRA
jgi:diguanylate cyclase (GGDEF)-like protein/PAS domain S-box-containing protein